MIWKISHLLKFEILSAFVNTMAADEKLPVRDFGNVLFLIQRIS